MLASGHTVGKLLMHHLCFLHHSPLNQNQIKSWAAERFYSRPWTVPPSSDQCLFKKKTKFYSIPAKFLQKLTEYLHILLNTTLFCTKKFNLDATNMTWWAIPHDPHVSNPSRVKSWSTVPGPKWNLHRSSWIWGSFLASLRKPSHGGWAA